MHLQRLVLAAVVVAGTTAQVGAVELSTPPIASRIANTFLSCAIQNAGTHSGIVRVQIVEVPSGNVIKDSGEQTVAPGAGVTAGAIALALGGGPPDCTNGDCPCPNTAGVESCGHFAGTAYCRFVVDKRKPYRAAGCVSAPASDPVSSPTCIEAR